MLRGDERFRAEPDIDDQGGLVIETDAGVTCAPEKSAFVGVVNDRIKNVQEIALMAALICGRAAGHSRGRGAHYAGDIRRVSAGFVSARGGTAAVAIYLLLGAVGAGVPRASAELRASRQRV